MTQVYLLVGSAMVHTVKEEFDNIKSWAAKNNLKIHPNKTKKIIFYRRRYDRAQCSSEPHISGAERVDALRVLGVILTPRLAMAAHLDRVLATCASSRFALRTLRSHGLRPGELHVVTRATTVSSLIYASLAWWGFTDALERSRLDLLIAGLMRAGYLPTDFPTFEELARQADADLFRPICSNPDHVLQHYFTPKKPSGRNLRLHAHIFNLLPSEPRNFVSRSVYGALL